MDAASAMTSESSLGACGRISLGFRAGGLGVLGFKGFWVWVFWVWF